MIAPSTILGPDGRPVSAERVKLEKAARFNPLRGWTPDVLVRQLEAYSRGEIAALAWVMEWLEKHDDVISTVAPKAKAAVSRWGYDILPKDEVTPEQKPLAEKQQAVLQQFYQSLKASDAMELEEAGGMRLLVQQIMDAYGKGYAAHHIIWTPAAGALTAELVKVPTWFFEVTTGRMRFLPSFSAQRGVELDSLGGRNAWMVSKGRGVMLAGVLARMFKQIPLQDWLTYCDRHGMPAFLGKTTATKGTSGWTEMRDAVAGMGSEFGAVINQGDVIDVLDLATTGEVPYVKLIDRMDRAQVRLWRGGDLSTMAMQDGVGGNAQMEDSDELDADNSAWVSETLNRHLTAQVISYTFGRTAPVLCELKLRTKTRDNLAAEILIVEKSKAMGVRISKSWFTNKFGVVEADASETALGESAAPAMPATAAINTAASPDAAMQALRKALAADMQPLADALQAAYQEGDLPAMQAALKKISANLPDLAGDATALGGELASQMARAWLGDTGALNTGNPAGAVKGWETRRRNGWQSQPKAANQDVAALVDDALDNTDDNSDSIALYSDVTPEEARLLGLPPGYKRGMSRHSIRHIFNSHGDPKVESPRGQIAVTREDIVRIPETIAKSNAAAHSGASGNVRTIRYYLDDAENGTTTVVDEVRSGRMRLIPVQLIKFKKTGMRIPM